MTRNNERTITDTQRDPADPRRMLCKLDCGHTVSRRINGAKRVVWCGLCL